MPNKDSVLVKESFYEVSKGVEEANIIRKRLWKRGFRVQKSTFYTMLSNVAYIGKVMVKADGDEKEMVVNGIHEGIVDEVTFAKVQKVINERKKNARRPSPMNENYPLKRHIKCPSCGKF